MKRIGTGAVVIIASIFGWKPAPRPQYGTAKAAEIYLAMELGRELASEGIRVNAVSPGSIAFPGGGWDSLRERDPERIERFVEQDLPFGRLGTPEEVADVVTFLLSERASWISGTRSAWTVLRAALPMSFGRKVDALPGGVHGERPVLLIGASLLDPPGMGSTDLVPEPPRAMLAHAELVVAAFGGEVEVTSP